MTQQRRQAPIPPGAPGKPPSPTALARFVAELVQWRGQLHDVIETLDQSAQGANHPDRHTADVTLAWTMWQAINRRTDDIVAAWDSGRLNHAQIDAVNTLVWARLDGGLSAALAVSLGEVGSLTGALVERLDEQLRIDGIDEVGATAASVRSAIAVIDQRLQKLRTERESLRELSEFAKSRIAGLRVLALPDCDALVVPSGEPAATDLAAWRTRRAELDAVMTQLDQLGRAYGEFRSHYEDPLAERKDLRGLLGGLQAMAASRGLSEQEEGARLYRAAHDALYTAPCHLDSARTLVTGYHQYLQSQSPPISARDFNGDDQ